MTRAVEHNSQSSSAAGRRGDRELNTEVSETLRASEGGGEGAAWAPGARAPDLTRPTLETDEGRPDGLLRPPMRSELTLTLNFLNLLVDRVLRFVPSRTASRVAIHHLLVVSE